jgi:hypothetical protein
MILALFLWRQIPLTASLLVQWGKIIIGTGIVFVVAWATRQAVGGIWMPVFLPALAGGASYLFYSWKSGLLTLIKAGEPGYAVPRGRGEKGDAATSPSQKDVWVDRITNCEFPDV